MNAAISAIDAGLKLCVEDEYANQEVGSEAFSRLKKAISK